MSTDTDRTSVWREGATSGETKTVQIAVTDSEGHQVGALTKTLIVGQPGESVPLTLDIHEIRGRMLFDFIGFYSSCRLDSSSEQE